MKLKLQKTFGKMRKMNVKRSKMLELLGYEIFDTMDDDIEVIANKILDLIEIAGMKPPWNDAEYQRQCRKYCDPEGYSWEQE